MSSYEVIEDGGGGLHLYVFDDDDNVIYAGCNFQYCNGALLECLHSLDAGENTDGWEDGMYGELGDPQSDYDNWPENEKVLVAEGKDGKRTLHRERMGHAALTEFGNADTETNFAHDTTVEQNPNEEKLAYVRSHIKMAPFWRTAKAIIASIPVSLIEPLTAEQLVVVADALHYSHERGKVESEAEILTEGAIYSPKHERMLEIEVPNA
jgi:hypothetical protein